jgi:uncharacterized protein (TIGR02284 family)
MSNDHSALTGLYELLGDSHKGYVEAAGRMKTPKLALFLSELGTERLHMQHELGAQIRQVLPGVTLEAGTLKGEFHRAWMDLREALAGAGEAAVLRECERGENYLLERFSTVLDDRDIPVGLFDVLRAQKTRVETALSTIKQLHATVVPTPDAAGARPI